MSTVDIIRQTSDVHHCAKEYDKTSANRTPDQISKKKRITWDRMRDNGYLMSDEVDVSGHQACIADTNKLEKE